MRNQPVFACNFEGKMTATQLPVIFSTFKAIFFFFQCLVGKYKRHRLTFWKFLRMNIFESTSYDARNLQQLSVAVILFNTFFPVFAWWRVVLRFWNNCCEFLAPDGVICKVFIYQWLVYLIQQLPPLHTCKQSILNVHVFLSTCTCVCVIEHNKNNLMFNFNDNLTYTFIR